MTSITKLRVEQPKIIYKKPNRADSKPNPLHKLEGPLVILEIPPHELAEVHRRIADLPILGINHDLYAAPNPNDPYIEQNWKNWNFSEGTLHKGDRHVIEVAKLAPGFAGMESAICIFKRAVDPVSVAGEPMPPKEELKKNWGLRPFDPQDPLLIAKALEEKLGITPPPGFARDLQSGITHVMPRIAEPYNPAMSRVTDYTQEQTLASPALTGSR